jgi:hypothetical protein
MFAVNTYQEIIKTEQRLLEKHIVVFLFVRPSLPGAREILEEFNYLHHNSQRYCSIYAVGYTDDPQAHGYVDYRKVPGIRNADWYYSDQAFVDFKNQLESRIKWRYSGEIELLILQSNPEGKQILNFQNFIAIDVNYGIRHEYIDSFPRFMESLVRSSRSQVEASKAVRVTQMERYKLTEIVGSAVDSCKRIPKPAKRLLKDRLFYRSSRSYT